MVRQEVPKCNLVKIEGGEFLNYMRIPEEIIQDVAKALGYKNTKDALATHIESCDKIMGSQNATPSITDSMGRTQRPTWINESGLYALIFGRIRTVTIDNEPWFVGKDVAESLGYKNASKALADHVEECDKLNNESLSSLGQRGGWLINESGLYALVFGSRLESAKKKSIRYVPSTNKVSRFQNAPTCLQKKVYTVGLQPVLWVKFSLLLIAYKSYTQCTKSRIRGI